MKRVIGPQIAVADAERSGLKELAVAAKRSPAWLASGLKRAAFRNIDSILGRQW